MQRKTQFINLVTSQTKQPLKSTLGA